MVNRTLCGQSVYVPCLQLVLCSWEWSTTFLICYTQEWTPGRFMYKKFVEDKICDVLLGFEGIEVRLVSGRISVG
jgi:hypothetical protein